MTLYRTARILTENLGFEYPSLKRRTQLFARTLVAPAILNANIAIHSNESVGLVGANGSGKTTLLRLLAGIYFPSEGRVTVLGQVTTMFDSGFGLDLESDGDSNVRLRGALLGRTNQEIQNAVGKVQDFVALGHKWNEPLRTYSSGMISRIVIGLATAFSSDVLLMDEAIGASDISFQSKANEKFRELLSQTATIVMATHDERLMENFCTRALLLNKGEIVEEGSVKNIWKRHRKESLFL